MSTFVPEIVTSPFAETGSSIVEVASVVHLPFYPNPLARIVVEEKNDKIGVFGGKGRVKGLGRVD